MTHLIEIAHIRQSQREGVRQEWFTGLILRLSPGAWSRTATWHRVTSLL